MRAHALRTSLRIPDKHALTFSDGSTRSIKEKQKKFLSVKCFLLVLHHWEQEQVLFGKLKQVKLITVKVKYALETIVPICIPL